MRSDEVRMPDLPANEKPPSLPERFQGCVKRKRNGMFNVKHKCFGILSGGILKLRRAHERNVKESKLSCEYVIELDKIHIYYNDRKRYIKLQFLKEAHFIIPVFPNRVNESNKELFDSWKCAFMRHRLYRQGQVRSGKVSSNEAPSTHLVSQAAVAKGTATTGTKGQPVIAKLTSPRRTPPRQNASAGAIAAKPAAETQRASRPLYDAKPKTIEEPERARKADELRKDIYDLLGTLKKTHETIKNSLACADADDENSSNEGSDEEEEPSTLSPVAKSGLPADGHRNLEETMSTSASPSTSAIEPIAKPVPADAKPAAVQPAVVEPSAKPIKELTLAVPFGAGNNVSPRVSAASNAQKSDSVLYDVYNILLDLKQVYDDLKLRVVKPGDLVDSGNGGPTVSEAANRLADTKVMFGPPLPYKPLATAVAPSPPPLAKVEKSPTDVQMKTKAKDELVVQTPVESPQLAVIPMKPKKQEPKEPKTAEEFAPMLFRPPRVRRTRLPAVQIDLSDIPYSCVLKGRLPIWAYEPLGSLQVLCEELRFASDLMGKAVLATSAAQRMAYVAAFVVSGYATLGTHKQKPFNPLRGETFDYVSEGGWQFHAEQVSHHPPVSASFAQHPDWEWHNCAKVEARFTLSGLGELLYKFPLTLTLHKFKEVYTYNKVKTIVMNPLKSANKRVIRQEGMLTIQCTNGVECRLLFSNCAENTVKGGIYENRKLTYQIIGNWDKGLTRILENNEHERLFEAPPISQELVDRYYGFTPFSVTLNELNAEEVPYLPPTDSRFRPDQRFLENGESQRAADAKVALEKNQRKREAMGNFQPMWFQPITAPSAGGPRPTGSWRSNGKYWESRATKFQDANSARMVKDLFKI